MGFYTPFDTRVHNTERFFFILIFWFAISALSLSIEGVDGIHVNKYYRYTVQVTASLIIQHL